MLKLCCLKLIQRGFPSQSKHERLFALFHRSKSQATEILQEYSCKAFKGGLSVERKVKIVGIDTSVTSASPEKRILLDNSVSSSPTDHNSLVLFSSPVKTTISTREIPNISPVRPTIVGRPAHEDAYVRPCGFQKIRAVSVLPKHKT